MQIYFNFCFYIKKVPLLPPHKKLSGRLSPCGKISMWLSHPAVRDALEHSQHVTTVRPHHGLEGAACFFSSLPTTVPLPSYSLPSAPCPSEGFLLPNEVCRGALYTLESSTCLSFRSLLKQPLLMIPSLTPRTTSNPREHVFTVPALHLSG